VLDVSYRNNGPSDASTTTITISMPEHTTFAFGSAGYGFHCVAPAVGTRGDLVCTAPNLANGANDYIELGASIDLDAVPGSTLTFEASLTSSGAVNPNQSAQGLVTITPPADIGISLASPSSVNPGDTFNATVTVTNKGPNPALNVVIAYNIKGGAQVTGVAGPAGWTCHYTSQQAVCSISSFPSGTTVTITPAMLLPTYIKTGPLQQSVFANTVSDANYSDNVIKTPIAVSTATQTTLSLAMTQSPATVHSGDTVSYTMQATNTGQVDAQGMSYYCHLPQGLTFVSSNCPALNADICNMGTLAAGATQSVTINAHVDAGAGTIISLYSIVTATNALGSQATNVVTSVSGTPRVDLRAILLGPALLRAGEVGIWSIGFSNNGPDVPTEWHLSFHIPSNATYTDRDSKLAGCSTPARGTFGGTIECEGSTMDYQPLLFVVGLSVPAGSSQPIRTTLTISTTNDDPVASNNTVAVDTAITTRSSLEAKIVSDKTAVVEGEIVTETFVVTNNGPDAATGVTINATAPSGVTFLTPSWTFDSCTGTFHCVAATLAPGASLTLTVPFRAPARVGGAESFFSGTSQNSAEFYMSSEILVLAPPTVADLSIAAAATPSSVSVGDLVTYTVSITNAGTSPASNVILTQSIPPSLAFASASVNCTGGNTLNCSIGTLAAGAWSTVTITARALVPGTVDSTSTVSTSSQEAQTTNNSSTVTVNVTAPAVPPRRRAAHH
jgi:uncharacterized repeat protein (TIGR01451 family)